MQHHKIKRLITGGGFALAKQKKYFEILKQQAILTSKANQLAKYSNTIFNLPVNSS